MMIKDIMAQLTDLKLERQESYSHKISGTFWVNGTVFYFSINDKYIGCFIFGRHTLPLTEEEAKEFVENIDDLLTKNADRKAQLARKELEGLLYD